MASGEASYKNVSVYKCPQGGVSYTDNTKARGDRINKGCISKKKITLTFLFHDILLA
jgi:hypothetical protein